jgi:hypothetical protein
MHLLSGASLRYAITGVLREQTVSCAVAFWGKGVESLIGTHQNRKIKLVCNLRMGGTNPDVIDRLIKSGMAVRQNDKLHAKVYIGDKTAIGTSANASINGLGIEGDELAGWIETGVEMSAQEALPWFYEIWNQSRPISRPDIEDARKIFRERAIMKPTRGSFADSHPSKEDFPLIRWVGNSNYDYNDSEIIKTLGRVNETVHTQIDFGLEIEAPEDVALFHRGVWVLHWPARTDGRPRQRSKFWWTCSSGIHVPNAFTNEGEDQPQGAVLAMHPMPPQPFGISDQQFRGAFREILKRRYGEQSTSAIRET